jgi:hypothetical protein
MEQAEYEAKVKKEADERDEEAKAEAEAALKEIAKVNSSQDDDDDETEDEEEEDRVDSTELAKAFLAEAQKKIRNDDKPLKATETTLDSSGEHLDDWEINVQRSKLKPVGARSPKALTQSETVMVKALQGTDAAASGIEEQVSPSSEQSGTVQSADSMDSTGSSPSPTKRERRTYKTAFTGVSPFDFAMQLRIQEKERREKEKEARESLAHHHAQQASSEKAKELKAPSLEERRAKQEAEENLKSYKTVNLGSEYATASELKKLQEEQKRKKKEAEEIQHHYKGMS